MLWGVMLWGVMLWGVMLWGVMLWGWCLGSLVGCPIPLAFDLLGETPGMEATGNAIVWV
jgi:hypothetical protein